MARSDDILLSIPHIVRFAGFESTTSMMQNFGWQIAAEQEFHNNSIRLLFSHSGCRLRLMARQLRYNFFNARTHDPRGETLVFEIQHCASDFVVQLMETTFNFKQIDAEPQWAKIPEQRNIDSFGIFAAPLVRTEEIIVEPQTVASLLDSIRKMQSPELAAIRKRNQQRDREPMNQQVFHAQIMSLAA